MTVCFYLFMNFGGLSKGVFVRGGGPQRRILDLFLRDGGKICDSYLRL